MLLLPDRRRERDSRAHPGCWIWGGGGRLSQLQFVFSSWTTIHPSFFFFWVVHLICIHLFPAVEAFSSLRRSLTISQNPAALSHYLLRNENTARRWRKKRKKEKRKNGKRRGEESRKGREGGGGVKGNTFFGSKQKRRAGIKESTVCVCALFSTLPWKRAVFLC